MKHVTFTRDVTPHRAGERRLLPDDIAARLEQAGEIEPGPPDWPPSAARDPMPDAAPKPAAKRPRYLTKESAYGDARR